jgi:hypothetical protein
MRTALHDAKWDGAWAGHEQSVPVAPDAEPEMGGSRSGNRQAKRWVLLVLVALAVPIPTPPLSGDGATRGLPRDSLFSFSPVETLLPPVDFALARLAAESASAGCWVQQLRPQGDGCAAR